MQLVQFLQDASTRAMRLSRETLDLKTSRELRVLSEELKAQAVERQKQIVGGATFDRDLADRDLAASSQAYR